MIQAFHAMVNTRELIENFSYNTTISWLAEAEYQYILTKRKPVVNLNTGEIYSGVSVAEQIVGKKGLSTSLSKCMKFNKQWWAYYTDDIGDYDDLIDQLELRAKQRQKERVGKILSTKALGKPTVINLTTKKTYISTQQASKDCGLSRTIVATAITKHHRAAGCWWEYIKNLPDLSDQTIQNTINQLEKNRHDRKMLQVKRACDSKPQRHLRKVRCIETGEIFESGEYISLLHGSGKYQLTNNIVLGYTFKGYHWEFVD